MNSPSRANPYVSTLSTSLHRIGCALAGEELSTIARAMFANDELRKYLLKKFLDMIDEECSELCRKTPNKVSLFRCVPIEKLSDFTWDAFATDLKLKAPTIYQVLSLIVSHSDHRNEVKKDRRHLPGICMAIATLLKERNREMCGLQSVISVALFASQVQKKVSNQV